MTTATKKTDLITFKGEPKTLVGEQMKPGDTAPDFTVTGTDLSPIKLSDYKGKVVILSVVPSVDTSVCSIQTKTFNEEADELGDDAVVLTVSMDLPFALKRFCGAEGVDNLVTASDYKGQSFACASGLLIEELGLLARAVYVIDKEGKVTYGELVSEVTDEPDYDKAIAAAKAAM